MKDVLEGTRGLAKNPLGIIALFVAFVYGLAALVLGVSVQHLQGIERVLLVGFVVGFPVLVLVAFCVLVVWHHTKLYGPGDYRDDESFLRAQGPVEREVRLEAKISGVVAAEEPRSVEEVVQPSTEPAVTSAGPKGTEPRAPVEAAVPRIAVSANSIGARVRDVASLGLLVVGRRLNLPIQPEVALGTTHSVPFDGGCASEAEYLVVEVKYLPRNWVSQRQITEIANRVLAAESSIRRLGDTRRLVLFLLLVAENATADELAAIRQKTEQVLAGTGFPHRFDAVTLQDLRREALGSAS